MKGKLREVECDEFLAPSTAHHIKTLDKEQYNKYQINMPTNIDIDSRHEFHYALNTERSPAIRRGQPSQDLIASAAKL